MQKLLCLGLEGCPGEAVIDGTVMVWSECLWARKAWDQLRDEQRIEQAFRALESTVRRWPTPAQFLDVLPGAINVYATALPSPEQLRDREAARISALKQIYEIAETLGWSVPFSDNATLQ